MLKTIIVSKKFIVKNWYIVDASQQLLGRLSSQIAGFLLNKHLKIYSSFLFPITNIIIINADKIVVSGKKLIKKNYLTYSGYQSGLHFKTFLQLKLFNIKRLFRYTIHGMLPKNRLGKALFSHLYIFSKNVHIYRAQQPIFLTLV